MSISSSPLPHPHLRSRSRSHSRSRSPILTFSPSPPDKSGVQTITRKVIKRLEGLGHLEMVDITNNNITTTPEDDTDDVPSSNVSDGEREREPEVEDYERAEVEKVVFEQLLRRNQGLNGFTHSHENGLVVNGNGVAKKKKEKIDWEIPRKLLHSSIGFFTLYLYISESDVSKVVLILWSSLCIIIPADFLRFRWPAFERLYERVLGFLMRESEKNSTNGVIWYILGVNFALQFYPRDVATVAILILSWADTAASTIGRLYGPSSPRLPPTLFNFIPLAPRKSLAGFIAATLTGTFIAISFWSWIAPMRFNGQELIWNFTNGIRSSEGGVGMLKGWFGIGVIGVVAGLISGVAEAMDLGSLDDNLTLPIISGGCILGFLKFVGWIGSLWTSSSS